MVIRELNHRDLESLHLLYSQLIERVPFHPRVTFEQFREQLRDTTCREKPGVFATAAERHLVAERSGRIAAFVSTAFAFEKAKFLAPRTGLLRFILALPNADDALQQLIAAATGELARFAPEHLRAMPYQYGPPFYNLGCGRLTGAWPWIGHGLMRAGFGVLRQYGVEIRMRRVLHSRPHELAWPTGMERRRVPGYSRMGPDFEYWYDLMAGAERLGQNQNLFGESYIRGLGHQLINTEFLSVAEPRQGQGLGRIMLRDTLLAAYQAGATEATLTADATNFAAMNLYRSEGYEPIDLLFEFEQPSAAGPWNVTSW